MWSGRSELHFDQKGQGGSMLLENDSADADDIESVVVDSIDNQCAQDRVTFVKMDVEGAEMEALKGAVNVIKRDHPKLAICIYHKPEDLYEIPFWIHEMFPEYKLYLRHHMYCIHETVIYATV